MKQKRVKLIYRNYKPIHEFYRSFIDFPPKGISYVIPKPKKYLRAIFPFYLKYGDNKLFKIAVNTYQKYVFGKVNKRENIDFYHFSQMLPSNVPNKNFMIDFEHVVSMSNFLAYERKVSDKIIYFTKQSNCKALVGLSKAAIKSLKYALQERYKIIESKVKLIYPALPNFYNLYKNKVDFSLVGKNNRFKLLFVGNDIYRKGLHELVEAFRRLKIYDMDLFIISNDLPNKDINSKSIKNLYIFKAKFSKEEIVRKFFIPCNLLILPTHDDTFGMVLLDSLASKTPVLTTNQFAAKEIIDDGRNGLFLKSEKLYLEDFPLPSKQTHNKYPFREMEEILINDIVKKINLVYNNRDLLKKLESNCLRPFNNYNKFSINKRNKEHLKIYYA